MDASHILPLRYGVVIALIFKCSAGEVKIFNAVTNFCVIVLSFWARNNKEIAKN